MLKKLALGVILSLSLSTIAKSANLDEVNQSTLQDLSKYANIDIKSLENGILKAQYQDAIIESITKPYEAKPWYVYKKLFLTKQRVDAAVKFFNENYQAFEKAYVQFGVEPEIILSILAVETMFGKNMGNWKVLDALFTLGFYYPPRNQYFSKEFANFIKLSEQENWDINTIKGSYAGAMGMGQFMPSSYLNYAYDFNNDGHINIFTDNYDAIGSVANYFKEHNWQIGQGCLYLAKVPKGLKIKDDMSFSHTYKYYKELGIRIPEIIDENQKVGFYSFDNGNGNIEYAIALNNFYTITRYNKSPLYARAVYELSELIAKQIYK